jgi:competence protein ComEA
MSPSTPPDEPASPADALDRLLRPDPRADLVERIRRLSSALDRRLIIAVAVVALLGFGGWALLVRGAEPAELTLPNAADSNDAGGLAPTAGSPTAGSPTVTVAAGEVVVHVAGAVVRPGLLRLPAGSRVADAIAAAGGPTPDGDVDRLNLAQLVEDGSRVVVGRIGESVDAPVPGVTPPAGSGAGADGEATSSSPIDLNTADLAELEELPGVGPSTAQAIIDHREANGPFLSVDDLLDVRGIGPAKLEALRDLAVVDGS